MKFPRKFQPKKRSEPEVSTEENFRELLLPLLLTLLLCAAFIPIKDSLNLKFLTVGQVAFLSGLTIKTIRLEKNLHTVLLIIGLALFFSSFVFLPGKNELDYDFDRHLKYWAFAFGAAYTFLVAIFHDKKLIPPLGEGTALVHGILLFYLILEYTGSPLLMGLCLIPLLYNVWHVFSPTPLTRTDRLVLSLYSTLSLCLIAGIYLLRLASLREVEESLRNESISEALLSILQLYLFGLSAAYVFQNFLLIFGYMPRKNATWEQNKKEMIELNDMHVARFSDDQVKPSEVMIVLIPVIIFLAWNYQTMELDPFFTICLVLVLFPVLRNYRRILTTGLGT